MDIGSIPDWLGLIFAIFSGAISVYLAREQLRELPFGKLKKTAIRIFVGLFIAFFVLVIFHLGKLSGASAIIEVPRSISEVETPVIIAEEVTREITRIVTQEVEIPIETIVEVTVLAEVTLTPVPSCQVPELRGRTATDAVNLISSYGLQPSAVKEYSIEPAGIIFSQDPLPGTELTPCQGSITYIESLGQLPTPTPTPLPTNTPAPDISFTDDFNSGASPDWDERTENWFTVNGTYTLREVGSDWTEGLALIGDNTWTDYTVSVEIDMKDSRDNIIDFRKESFILLRVQNEDNLIALRFTDGGYFRQAAWFLVENGIWNEVGNTRLERIYPIDNAFSVQVEVKGDFITANVNGTEMSFSGVPFSSGGIGLRIYTRNNNNPPTFDHFMIRPIAP